MSAPTWFPPAPGAALATGDRHHPAARRRRRRHWLLWGSAVVWLPLLVMALGVLLRDANVRSGVNQFRDGDFTGAARKFEHLGPVDLFEQWKEPFDLGTALYMTDDLWGAERELDRALEVVPEEHRCTVQINRSLVLEAWGDQEMVWSQESAGWAARAQELTDAGQPYPDMAPWGAASPEQLRRDAEDSAAWAARYYADAIQARQDPACGGQPEDEQEQNQQSQERLEQKEDDAQQQAEPQDAPETPPSPGTDGDEEAQRQRELAERQAEAEADAEAERQAGRGGTGGGGGGW